MKIEKITRIEAEDLFELKDIGDDEIMIMSSKAFTARRVSIPDLIDDRRVTVVGERAFDAVDMKSLSLPSTLKRIGSWSFAENYLKEIILPDGLVEIGDHAFAWSCDDRLLKELVIPASVERIERCAFLDVYIKKVIIKNKNTVLGEEAFGEYVDIQYVE